MSATPTSPRREISEIAYQKAKVGGDTIPLDREQRLISYKYWYLIKNRFPYDMIYAEHDMLLPVSGVATRNELNVFELSELAEIIDELCNQYDLYFENFAHRRSVKYLYHLHFARYYRTRTEMRL